MLLSVAICTHDRADHLERALGSLRNAKAPDDMAWELLVVLNDCADNSAEIVLSFADWLPVVAIEEPQLGHSHARNCAAQHCRGDFIVFIDDDVVVDPMFLVAYQRAILRWPENDVFSGPIVPVFEGGSPAWLKRVLPAVGSAFAQQTVDRDGAPIEPFALPYGANYAIRRSVQLKWPYDPNLGRGDVEWLRGGEETEVLEAVFAAGSRGRWVRDASVEHIIGHDRQTLSYLWQYYEGYGILVGIQERKRGRRRHLPMLSALAEMATADLGYRLKRLAGPSESWASSMIRAAVRRGKWKSRRLLS